MKKQFTQLGKSEATLTTRFPVSDFLTMKARCSANALRKTANVIRERSMTSESTATKFLAKKTNTAAT